MPQSLQDCQNSPNPQSSRYLKETEKLNYPEHCLQKARNNNDKTIYRYPRIFLFILPVK